MSRTARASEETFKSESEPARISVKHHGRPQRRANRPMSEYSQPDKTERSHRPKHGTTLSGNESASSLTRDWSVALVAIAQICLRGRLSMIDDDKGESVG